MAVTLVETAASGVIVQDLKNPTGYLEYLAFGSYDVNEVEAAVLAEAPARYGYLWRSKLDPKPKGGGVWLVGVDYEVPDAATAPVDNDANGGEGSPPPDPDKDEALTPEYSIEISAATQHITFSGSTFVSGRPVGSTDAIPGFNHAIGVTKDHVEGVDKVVPQMEWSKTVYLARLTMRYVRQVVNAVGTTNDRVFYNFDAGELLFLGCSVAKYVVGQGWPCTFKFSAGANRADVRVSDTPFEFLLPNQNPLNPGVRDGNGNPYFPKNAWDYLWVYYGEGQAQAGAPTLQQPKFAYVERIYDASNFKAVLGI